MKNSGPLVTTHTPVLDTYESCALHRTTMRDDGRLVLNVTTTSSTEQFQQHDATLKDYFTQLVVDSVCRAFDVSIFCELECERYGLYNAVVDAVARTASLDFHTQLNETFAALCDSVEQSHQHINFSGSSTNFVDDVLRMVVRSVLMHYGYLGALRDVEATCENHAISIDTVRYVLGPESDADNEHHQSFLSFDAIRNHCADVLKATRMLALMSTSPLKLAGSTLPKAASALSKNVVAHVDDIMATGKLFEAALSSYAMVAPKMELRQTFTTTLGDAHNCFRTIAERFATHTKWMDDEHADDISRVFVKLSNIALALNSFNIPASSSYIPNPRLPKSKHAATFYIPPFERHQFNTPYYPVLAAMEEALDAATENNDRAEFLRVMRYVVEYFTNTHMYADSEDCEDFIIANIVNGRVPFSPGENRMVTGFSHVETPREASAVLHHALGITVPSIDDDDAWDIVTTVGELGFNACLNAPVLSQELGHDVTTVLTARMAQRLSKFPMSFVMVMLSTTRITKENLSVHFRKSSAAFCKLFPDIAETPYEYRSTASYFSFPLHRLVEKVLDSTCYDIAGFEDALHETDIVSACSAFGFFSLVDEIAEIEDAPQKNTRADFIEFLSNEPECNSSYAEHTRDNIVIVYRDGKAQLVTNKGLDYERYEFSDADVESTISPLSVFQQCSFPRTRESCCAGMAQLPYETTMLITLTAMPLT